jgi:hypothetical protein
MSNNQTGYWAGGMSTWPLGPTANGVTIQDLASETASGYISIGGTGLDRYWSGAVSNQSFGWVVGGGTPTNASLSFVDRYDFSSFTSSIARSGELGRQQLAGVSNYTK